MATKPLSRILHLSRTGSPNTLSRLPNPTPAARTRQLYPLSSITHNRLPPNPNPNRARHYSSLSRNPTATRRSHPSRPIIIPATAVTPRCGQGQARRYASSGEQLTADDYIQELQDLYEIAKDELEIAADSTASNTIYAVSDRITLREAFDDLDHAYALYTGTKPHPVTIAQLQQLPQQASSGGGIGTEDPNAAESWGLGMNNKEEEGGGGVEGESERYDEGAMGEGKRSVSFDPEMVPGAVREEIKRRVGQRVRELRGAVEALEESAREGG
ncbi:hypothetical protein FQN50_008326 [Emmonsiellopsis sp. PD_5]|nr:hypothetical protein FQN50_008326 [Emmonsiellopsis sp. PD_5]